MDFTQRHERSMKRTTGSAPSKPERSHRRTYERFPMDHKPLRFDPDTEQDSGSVEREHLHIERQRTELFKVKEAAEMGQLLEGKIHYLTEGKIKQITPILIHGSRR